MGYAHVYPALGQMSNAFSALMSDGDVLKTKEKDNFVKLFASYVNGSNAKVPDTDTTYKFLLEAVPAMLSNPNLPS